MCLIVFAWQVHPKYPLVIATNRDEFHKRPTQALRWWADEPTLLGGRDLQAGGTWLAVARNGRIALVTNYREGYARQSNLRSRGELVTQFLTGEDSPNDYAINIPGDRYAGFNLLAADHDELCYLSTYLPQRENMKMPVLQSRDLPIFMAHGTFDRVLPLAMGVSARDSLMTAGFDVDWREYPMAHAVCPDEIADIRRWLMSVFEKTN